MPQRFYATNRDAHHHLSARVWFEGALAGREPVGFAWAALLAFLRVSTGAPFERRLESREAIDPIRSWLEQRPSVIVEPTSRHLGLVGGLLGEAGAAGNLVQDAHLAALALEHDATFVTFDRDFGRFEGVRWEIPRGG